MMAMIPMIVVSMEEGRAGRFQRTLPQKNA
jgi:hypothetical protein